MKFKMYYISVILIIFSLFSNEVFSQDFTKNMKDNSKIYKGKIVKVNFVDKAGREYKDIFNYFLETKDKQYFIKTSEGEVSKDEIANHYNKEIKVRAIIILFGLWDTSDPNVQSRVGDYLIFKEIL